MKRNLDPSSNSRFYTLDEEQEKRVAALLLEEEVGPGRSVALHCRSSTPYHTH
jgi:hypothetical protein